MNKTLRIFPLLFSALLAQKNLTGTISDESSGDPLIGANVIITNDDFNTGAATDQNGYFSINSVPNGDYDIRVSYIGYGDYQNKISITDNSTTDELELDIKLSISAISLQEYVVTASRGKREKITDAPAAISVISELKIRTQSNPNLGDYLKGTKGIDFTQSGIDSYNMTARGFNSSFSSRLLTLTDGRMANVPSLRLTAYNVIPVSFEDVEQIEVVLGPSSALYGPNAHSGVLNIVRRKIELKCQAESIPEDIEISLSGLDIGASVRISSVKLPENSELTITDRDFVVATIAAPTIVKEPEKPAEETTDESAEGETAATSEGAEAKAPAKEGEPAGKKDEKSKDASADKKPSSEKKQTEKK